MSVRRVGALVGGVVLGLLPTELTFFANASELANKPSLHPMYISVEVRTPDCDFSFVQYPTQCAWIFVIIFCILERMN